MKIKTETIQIIFNILLFITIICLIFTTVSIVKNIRLIKTNGISYVMELNNFTSCSCSDYNNTVYNIKGDKINQDIPMYNYSLK